MQTEVLPSLVDHAERLNISTFLDVSTPASPVIELADAQDNRDRTHSFFFFQCQSPRARCGDFLREPSYETQASGLLVTRGGNVV